MRTNHNEDHTENFKYQPYSELICVNAFNRTSSNSDSLVPISTLTPYIIYQINKSNETNHTYTIVLHYVTTKPKSKSKSREKYLLP